MVKKPSKELIPWTLWFFPGQMFHRIYRRYGWKPQNMDVTTMLKIKTALSVAYLSLTFGAFSYVFYRYILSPEHEEYRQQSVAERKAHLVRPELLNRGHRVVHWELFSGQGPQDITEEVIKVKEQRREEMLKQSLKSK